MIPNDVLAYCRSLTAKALSAILGVEKSLPHYWMQHGCPRNTDGSYDLAAVFHWKLQHESEKREKGDLVGAQLAAMRAVKTKREELRLGIESGRLIDAETTFRNLQQFFSDARTLLETIPDSIGMLLVETEMRQMIVEESRRFVSDALRTLAAAESSFYEGAISATFATSSDTDAGVFADGLAPAGPVG